MEKLKNGKTTDTGGNQNYTYEAFISYRHIEPDMSIAKALHRSLERFSIPGSIKKQNRQKKMGKVFRDRDELPTSPDLGGSIENALERSKWLIIICTPEFLQSKWCLREVDYFIELGRRDRVLALLLQGEPRDSFPRQLRFMNIDGETVELEPLAADVRGESTGDSRKKLRRERLRLLAPMLNVSFDDLFRRSRRLLIKRVVSLALAAVLLMTGAGGIFLNQSAKTARANSIAAQERVGTLIGQSESLRLEGRQRESVLKAKEALETARLNKLDERAAVVALYNAEISFPSEGAFARLPLSGGTRSVAFSEDGTLLATCSQGRHITVWKVLKAAPEWEMTITQLSIDFEMTFTAQNELVLVFSDTQRTTHGGDTTIFVQKYDSGGNLLFSKETQMFSLNGIVYWEAANVIAVQGNYGGPYIKERFGEYDGGNNNCCVFIDADTGEIKDEYDMFLHGCGLQLSTDGKSLCALSNSSGYSNSPQKRLLRLFHVDARAGISPGARVTVDNSEYVSLTYLEDKTFVWVDDEGIYIWKDVEETALYPIFERDDENDPDGSYDMNSVEIITGNEKGEFLLAFSDFVVRYAYDGDTGDYVYLEECASVDYSQAMLFLDWAEKDKNTVFYLVKVSAGQYTLRSEDSEEYYRNYTAAIPDEAKCLSSKTGTLAVYGTDINYLWLYNLKTEDPYITEPAGARYQVSPPYFDMEKNLCITQGINKDGLFFELSFINKGQFTNSRRVYLPDTQGYSVFTAEYLPYAGLGYGKDYAVIFRRSDREQEAPYDFDVFILDYETAKITQIDKHILPDLLNKVGSISDTGFTLYSTFIGPTIYDKSTGKVWDNWNAKGSHKQLMDGRDLIAEYGGPNGQQLFFYLLMDRDTNALHLGRSDFYGNALLAEKETTEPMNIVWSPDAKRAFAIFRDRVDVYETGTMKLLGKIDPGVSITSARMLENDTLALIDDAGSVLFYNAKTLAQKAVAENILGTVNGVSFNPVNGLCVISSEKSVTIFDLNKGETYLANIQFPSYFKQTDTADFYISGDGAYLICAFRTDAYYINRYTDPFPHYEYAVYPLLGAERLLEIARQYE